jgi:enhanced filamentous growth protein 1
LLYPLFVHNIGALLYHPTNQTRTNQVMAAAERRKQEQQNQMRNAQPPPPGLPSIGQHHHHSMGLPGPQPSLPSHGNMGRPALDRAHTFPTPPTSASSLMGGSVGTSDGFQWAQSQGMSGAQGTNPMSIDTGLNSTRSMPTTPATTPPGSSIQSMQAAYPAGSQPYDSSRQMYSAAPSTTQQSPYQPSNAPPQDRSMYGQPNSYVKNEMGPPAARPDQPDNKAPNGIIHHDQNGQPAPHPASEEEAEHEHDAEYTHDSGAYDANRASYNYSAPPVGSLTGEHPHLSPEMTGSPSHQAGSGRATPRTAAAPQPYYSQQGGYTPPRAQQPSSNLYNVMSNDRGSTNGAPGSDGYAPQADMGGSMTNGYSSSQPVMNGATGGMKRGREEEDELPRPSSGGPGMGGLDLKRRKTMMESTVSAPAYDSMNRPASAIAQRRR